MKKPILIIVCTWILLHINLSITLGQGQEVTGTVRGEDNELLPGVNVILKDTRLGVLTNAEGKYSINIPDSINRPILIFSFVGFSTLEKPVGNESVVNATLTSETKELKEVVVVGYGVIDRQKLAGSVSSIGAESIEEDPVASLNQAVQGKMAGVQVTQNSGTPGGGLNFRIRGINTLNNSTTEPLYVIDGIPINTDNYTGIGREGRQSLNPLATINPADIASIEVLKDASAIAIYGARAANGVVLVTTKKGKSGSNQVNINAYYGIQELPDQIDMANADQYIQYMRDIYALNPDVEPNPEIFDRLADTNWQDEIYQTAPIQSYTLSTSGGSENTTYYISGAYFNQEGIVINSGFERINFKTNVEHQLSDKFTIGTNINLSRSTNDRVPEDFGRSAPVQLALISRSNVPVYDENGDYYVDGITNRDNAVASAELTEYEDKTDRVIANAYLEYDIIEGLTFRTNWGIDKTDIEGHFYIPKEVIREGITKQGFRTNKRFRTYNWLNENTLNFNRTFGDHAVTVLVGNTLQQADMDEITLNATNFVSDDVTDIGSAGVYTAGDRVQGWSLASFFSRVHYVFKDRYILTANYRIDGSSRFGEDNRYAYFPSVALAWRLSEEDFIKDLGIVNNLKLRASWGQSGNQPRDFYQSLPLYGLNAYYGDNVGFAPTVIGNSELSWETTTQTNIGLDIGLFDERISILADYYIKNTDDLLTSLRLPEATGELFTLVNLGEIRNTGFEFELSSKNIVQNDFRWITSLNMSFPKNEVTSLPGGDVLDGLGDASHLAREGYPVGSFYGYVAMGVNPETGNIMYADIDGDGETSLPGALDTDDRTIIGNPHPDFYGGVTNTFFYGAFDLSIQGQFVYGNDVFNFTRRSYESLTGAGVTPSTDALDYWKQPGDVTEYPRPTYGNSTNNLVSTRWVEDGSFFRIRDVTLGFNMPQEWTDKVSRLRFYLQVQNLYNFTSYDGYDPEINVYENRGSMIGADYGSYPRARTYLVGLNLTF